MTIPGCVVSGSTSATSSGTLRYAFDKTVQEVVISDPITRINNYAFAQCTSLTTLTYTGTLKSIGSHAFSACTSLTAFPLQEGLTTIGTYAFSDCRKLAGVTLPSPP